MGRFKEILIFVAGAAPQIITETIYALSQKKPAIYPDEIFIITTSIGKRIIINSLIKGKILESLIKEYALPPINLSEENFIVPRDAHGREIDDIKTSEENEIIGDLITSFIREKTRDQSARLHCSLAGGRKTMSFYLGSALQLFGRPWDRLYHVLVDPAFESHPDFFYKPKKNKYIQVKDKDGRIRRLSTREARIYLAELPFIRLSQKLKLQKASFRELVAESQREIDLATIQPELVINLKDRCITIGEKTIYFQPRLLFIYLAFIHQKINKCPYIDRPYCHNCSDCYEELTTLFSYENLRSLASYFRSLYGGAPLKFEDFIKHYSHGLDVAIVRQYLSKLKKIFQTELEDESLWSLYIVQAKKIYAASRYGLRSEKSKISIEGS